MYNYLYSIVPITELDARIPRLERLAEDVRSVNDSELSEIYKKLS